MTKVSKKLDNLNRRRNRIRSVLKGTSERPRLSVYVSNQHINAQIIDDSKQATIVSVTTVGQKEAKGTLTDKAVWAGSQIAKKAKSIKIKKVVFDRAGRKYHGRIKALADAARKEGLEF